MHFFLGALRVKILGSLCNQSDWIEYDLVANPEDSFASNNAYTVKPAVAATSIKRDPPVSGQFRAPRTILNANAPLLSVHLSNAASGRRNSPQNTEIVSSNGQFQCVDAASFD